MSSTAADYDFPLIRCVRLLFDGFGSASRPFPFCLCWRAIAAAVAGPSTPQLRHVTLGMPGAERVSPVLARSQVPIENVLSLHDVREVYTVPEMLEKQARAAAAAAVSECSKRRANAAAHASARRCRERLLLSRALRPSRASARPCGRPRAANPVLPGCGCACPACPREAWHWPGCGPADRSTFHGWVGRARPCPPTPRRRLSWLSRSRRSVWCTPADGRPRGYEYS